MRFGEINYNNKHHHERPKKPFSFLDRIKSFQHGINGLIDIIKTEHNAWIHAVATILVLIMSWWLGLSPIEWAFILVAIAAVWMAEAFNTVIEMLVDFVAPTYTQPAKRAKDIGAAAVLIVSIGSSIVGLIILGPPFLERIKALFS